MSLKTDIIETEFRTKGGSVVQREVGKISKEIATLTDKNKNLKLVKAKLEAEDKKYIAGTKKLSEAYKNVKKAISDNNGALTIQKAKLELQSKKLKISEMSSSQLKKKTIELRRELSGMSKELMPEQWNKLNKQLLATEKQMGKVSVGTKKTQGVMEGMKQILPSLGFAAIIAGAVQVGKKLFSMVQETMEYRKQVQQLTGEEGQSLADLTANIEASSGTFKKEFEEMAIANNTLAKTFDISQAAANNLIDKGFIAGADASGEFLDMLKEYPTQFKAAGLSAEQSIALMAQSVKEGVYSDKGADAIKEGTLRLREMTQATRDALEGVGISSTQLEADLKNGTITYFDAIQQVSTKLDDLPPQSVAVGTALADIFGGPGEDAGLEYITMLGNVDTSLDTMISKTGESGAAQMKLLEANKKLSGAWSELMGTGTGTITALTAGAKGLLADGIMGLIGGLKGVRDWFIDIYNESTAFRAWIQGLLLNFNLALDVIKLAFNGLWVNLKSGGKLIKAIFTFDIDGIKDAISGWKDGMTTAVVDGAKEIGADFADAYNETVKGKIDPVKQEVETVVTTVSNKINSESNESNTSSRPAPQAPKMLNIDDDDDDMAEADGIINEYLKANETQINKYLEARKELASIQKEFGLDRDGDQYAEAMTQLEDFHDQKLISEEEYLAAKQGIEDAYNIMDLEADVLAAETDQEKWDAKFDLAEERYALEFEQAEGNRLLELKAEKKHEKSLLEIAQAKIDAEYDVKDERINAGQKYIGALQGFVEKESALGKVLFLASQGLAIAQVWTNLGREIAGLAAMAHLTMLPGAADIYIAAASAKATGMAVANTALIAAQTITGLESGGYANVNRAQDNKEFRAKLDPKRRGYIDKTSLLVSENGGEFVGNAAAVQNSSIRPFFDVIDQAQQNGTISTLNLPEVMGSMGYATQGKESGGYTKQTQTETESAAPQTVYQSDPASLAAINKLNAILEGGISTNFNYSKFQKKSKQFDNFNNKMKMTQSS